MDKPEVIHRHHNFSELRETYNALRANDGVRAREAYARRNDNSEDECPEWDFTEELERSLSKGRDREAECLLFKIIYPQDAAAVSAEYASARRWEATL